MRKVAALLAAGLLFPGTPGARAEEPPPTVEALVEEALRQNPDVRAAEEAVEAARHRPSQASALPDPMVSLSYTNDGWSPSLGQMPMSRLEVMASQDLPPPGARALRGRMAERDVQVAEQQLARVRRSLEASVRRAWASLVQSRAIAALVDEQEQLWQQIEGVARARYSVGQGAQQDVLRVQVELTRVGQQRIEQEAESEVRQAELNRLLARAAEEPLPTPSAAGLAPYARPLETTLARLQAESPELKAATLEVERAKLAVALARTQFKPAFSVQAGYMNRGGLDPMWQAGVGVTLPLRKGWRRAGLAEAEGRRRQAEALARSAQLQLRLRTQERLAQLWSAERMAHLYERGIVPQDNMAVEAAIASYQAGQVPFLSVLEATATLYGDRATFIRLVAGHERARASLEEASLLPTNDVGPPGAMGVAGMGAAAAFARTPVGSGAAGASGADATGGMASMGER